MFQKQTKTIGGVNEKSSSPQVLRNRGNPARHHGRGLWNSARRNKRLCSKNDNVPNFVMGRVV